jgi:hypothetical protein
MHFSPVVLVLCASSLLAQEPPPPPPAAQPATPELSEILRRVAENQEKAVAARSAIVYTQETRTRLMRGGSKLAREEKRRYTVTPTATATERKLEFFEGRYRKGGQLLPYTDPKFRYKGMDIDGDLVDDMTDDMVNNKESRDGIPKNLFPLTAKEQEHYTFKLAGTQTVNGVNAIRIQFEPNKDQEEREWAGEVLVDPVEYQPVRVVTRLAFNIPWAVKVFLGTNVRQLGFSVTYRKVADELWFPVSYGTEFHLRVLFGYARTIVLSMDNRDFKRASAESSIQYGAETKP